MKTGLDSTLREAMRLIRAGDVGAATAAIRQELGGLPPGAARPTAGELIEGKSRVLDHAFPDRDATPAASPRFDEHTFAGPAGARDYKLFVPGANREQPMPLIVMLHGCTQSPDDFAAGTRMNLLAEEHGFVVAYPAQSASANGSKCWNWFKTGDQRRDRGEPAIIAGMVRELLATHGLDPERVYVAGLSSGGAMAVILARAYGELFAAAGVHSGLPYAAAHDVPSALAAMKGGSGTPAARGRSIPTIVFHGDLDATVHPSNGAKVVADAVEGATVESFSGAVPGGHPHTRRVFSNGAGQVVAEHWIVHGAAHAWSGGDPRGSHTDSRGLDASREMVRFFLQHRRRAPLPGLS